jgi:hypothetical protein
MKYGERKEGDKFVIVHFSNEVALNLSTPLIIKIKKK